jgi:hypothetical protein
MIDVKVGEFIEFCQDSAQLSGTVRSVTNDAFTVAVQYWRNSERGSWRKMPRTGDKLPLWRVRKYSGACCGLGLECRWAAVQWANSRPPR